MKHQWLLAAGQFLGAKDATEAVLCDLNTGKQKGKTLAHGGKIVTVFLCPDGKTALTISERPQKKGWAPDSQLIRWDLDNGEKVGGPWEVPKNITRIAAGADDDTVLLHQSFPQGGMPWSLSKAGPVHMSDRFAGGKTRKTSVTDFRFSADWHLLALNRSFGVGVIPYPAGEPELWSHEFSVRVDTLAVTPDSSKVLTATLDGQCRFWEARTGKPCGTAQLPKGYAQALAFSPDSQMFIAATSERTARLWDSATCRPLSPVLPLTSNTAPHMAFNAPGTHFFLHEDETHLYRTPRPLQGNVERIVMASKVLTGLELDSEGRMQILNAAQWQQYRNRLQELGGPPASE